MDNEKPLRIFPCMLQIKAFYSQGKGKVHRREKPGIQRKKWGMLWKSDFGKKSCFTFLVAHMGNLPHEYSQNLKNSIL